MKTPSLVLMLALAWVDPGLAQVAGHDTVPTQGPAARDRHTEVAADDAVLVQVDRLRRDLADLARRYRKAKGAERDVLGRHAEPLLDQMAMGLRDLSVEPPRATVTAAPEVAAKATYLVLYRPGPAWLPGRPLAEQPLREHGRYVLGLHTQGALRFAGPFTDDGGGAMVIEAASEEEAAAIVAADPAVTSKVMIAERHPWRLVDWEQRAKSARPQP